MDKTQERVLLDYVFGSISDVDVVGGERPDFRCRAKSGCEFGVEVAEFFLNESVARLRRITGYAKELLSTETYRHKLDRHLIPVKEVLYKRANTGEERKIRAIAGEEYTVTKVVERFVSLIRDKNGKFDGYDKSIRAIDLIIHDVDGITGRYEIADLIREIEHIGARASVVSSPFREIIIVTWQEPTAQRCVPLRASFFASEVFAFQTMFKEFHGDSIGQRTLRDYLLGLAAYLVGEFNEVEYATGGKNSPEFFFASVAVGYGKNQSLDIRDVSGEAATGRTKLREESDVPVLDPDLKRFVSEKRPTMFCCVPICFSAFGAKAPSASDTNVAQPPAS